MLHQRRLPSFDGVIADAPAGPSASGDLRSVIKDKSCQQGLTASVDVAGTGCLDVPSLKEQDSNGDGLPKPECHDDWDSGSRSRREWGTALSELPPGAPMVVAGRPHQHFLLGHVIKRI